MANSKREIMMRGMFAKVSDKLLLVLTLIAISPLIIAALVSITIGYAFHLMTSFNYSPRGKRQAA